MKTVLFGLIILLFLSNCGENYDQVKPPSTGSSGHVLVVMDKQKWNGPAGDTIRAVFNQDYLVLPQSEPVFDYSHIPSEAFSSLLRRTRNILFVDISVNTNKPEVLLSYDLYAYPQLMVTVKAKDVETFIHTFGSQYKKILNAYEKAEKERLILGYSGKLLNTKIKSGLEQTHFYTLNVPTGYNLDVDSAHFVWISRETPSISQGILIWDYPYRDTSDLNQANLIRKRDEITKKYVPGPATGSYMTSEKLIDPHYSEYKINQTYTIKLKGLWRVDGVPGIFMGGPFVSYTIVDKKRNRIVTADGYVFGGEKKKRELVRQVDAILSTLKIIE
jgi:hypothetical protein